jgi:hypothetical protein
VARQAVRALEKHYDSEEGDGWAVRLQGLDERLSVSRRQLTSVRETIAAGHWRHPPPLPARAALLPSRAYWLDAGSDQASPLSRDRTAGRPWPRAAWL